jgi:osmoprotectant transport system substrate-binding protein
MGGRSRAGRGGGGGLGVVLGVALVVVIGGCGGSSTDVTRLPDLHGVHLTIGSTRMDDSVLLAELYAQALEAKGATVTRHDRLATRRDYYPLLQDGTVDMVPERTGALLQWLTEPSTPTAKTVADQLQALRTALPGTLTVLSPTAADDKEGVACRADVAAELSLRTISDLEHASRRVTVGATQDARSQLDGALASVTPLADDTAVADALDEGAVDCGTLHLTDPVIIRDHLVALDDDQLLVPNQVVLPLISTAAATPAVQAVLDATSSTLDAVGFRTLLAEVELDGKEPDEVVRHWLEANRLGR